jgi:hypothetical protein
MGYASTASTWKVGEYFWLAANQVAVSSQLNQLQKKGEWQKSSWRLYFIFEKKISKAGGQGRGKVRIWWCRGGDKVRSVHSAVLFSPGDRISNIISSCSPATSAISRAATFGPKATRRPEVRRYRAD